MPPTQNTPVTQPPEGNNDTTMIMGILAYLGPLVIVPFLVAKDNNFVRFHVKQGMILFAIEMILYVVTGMMMFNLLFLLPIITIINFACMILSIVGIVYVVQKVEKPLPVIGSLTKHLPF
jgi:uncharacterized membrane protein